MIIIGAVHLFSSGGCTNHTRSWGDEGGEASSRGDQEVYAAGVCVYPRRKGHEFRRRFQWAALRTYRRLYHGRLGAMTYYVVKSKRTPGPTVTTPIVPTRILPALSSGETVSEPDETDTIPAPC